MKERIRVLFSSANAAHKANASSKSAGVALAIVDVEPHPMGFLQSYCECTDPTQIPVSVASSGHTGVSGFGSPPNNFAGLLRGYGADVGAGLRPRIYNNSFAGTGLGVDMFVINVSDAEVPQPERESSP